MTSELIGLSDAAEERLADELEQINHFIFEHPELGLEERVSSRYLAEYLSGKGFEVTMPFAGLETAFRAQIGDGDGPTVAFLAEYDALPGYGPEKKPGHACGHNWIAATTVGAGAVLAQLADRLHGRIVVFGTPAEETFGGKALMANEHCFDDVDAALQLHLGRKTALTGGCLAMCSYKFSFKGKAAHASAAPQDGINALDAVQLTFAGINALRQHILSSSRIHGIVTDGGVAPNIVPEDAACLFFIRAPKRDYRDRLVEKVINCARGAALMTGAALTVEQPDLPLDDFIEIPSLKELMCGQLNRVGIPADLVDDGEDDTGSTDVGNVSYVCPALYADIAVRPDMECDCHEEAFLAEMDSPAVRERLHQGVRALCGAAITLLCEPELTARVRREFNELKAAAE